MSAKGETSQTMENNSVSTMLTSMMENLNVMDSHMSSIEGSINTIGGGMDNIEGQLNSIISIPQNYLSFSSRRAQNKSDAISPRTLHLMLNPPRPLQEPTTQTTTYL